MNEGLIAASLALLERLDFESSRVALHGGNGNVVPVNMQDLDDFRREVRRAEQLQLDEETAARLESEEDA